MDYLACVVWLEPVTRGDVLFRERIISTRISLAGSCKGLCIQLGLRELLGIELSILVLVQSIELRRHEVHPLLLGDFPIFVGIHQ